MFRRLDDFFIFKLLFIKVYNLVKPVFWKRIIVMSEKKKKNMKVVMWKKLEVGLFILKAPFRVYNRAGACLVIQPNIFTFG